MKLQIYDLNTTMCATVTCTCGGTFFDADNGHSSDTFSHAECSPPTRIKIRCQNPRCKKEYLLAACEGGFQLEKL